MARLAAAIAALFAMALPTLSVGPPQRTITSSNQFVIYCDDTSIRSSVAGFVESRKKQLLALLEMRDTWKYPIVIHISPESSAAAVQRPSAVRMFEVETGFKVEVDIQIGRNLADIQLEKQIVRALYLELAYRESPNIQGGVRYNEPPAWLVEGTIQLFQNQTAGPESELFRTLIDANRLPSIADFLSHPAGPPGSAAQALHRAYAVSLLQLLIESSNGRLSLRNYIAAIPSAAGDPVEMLLRLFPQLGSSPTALERWWTLSIARFSASERYKALTLQETEVRLNSMLSEIVMQNPKTGEEERYPLREYGRFIRSSEGKQAMRQIATELSAISSIAHPLLRDLVGEYVSITSDLSRGKTRQVEARLEAAAEGRVAVLTRAEEIGDYMNWFEATQPGTLSGVFDRYLQTATSLETQTPAPRDDPISKYLDSVAVEFE